MLEGAPSRAPAFPSIFYWIVNPLLISSLIIPLRPMACITGYHHPQHSRRVSPNQ
jgi:hypothetical protein